MAKQWLTGQIQFIIWVVFSQVHSAHVTKWCKSEIFIQDYDSEAGNADTGETSETGSDNEQAMSEPKKA